MKTFLSCSHDHCAEIRRCMVGPFEKDNLLDCQGLYTVKHSYAKYFNETNYDSTQVSFISKLEESFSCKQTAEKFQSPEQKVEMIYTF